MARRKNGAKQKKNRVRGRRRAVLPAVLIALLLLIGGFLGYMAGNARLTRLKYADVYLPDLPPAFEGTTLLYMSDISVRNTADSAASVRLVKKLRDLQPDLLLLGGDYSANTLLEQLNGAEGGNTEHARAFIEALADLPAPMGKFAVAGDMDNASELAPLFADSGVQLLTDACALVKKDGSELIIAGLNDARKKTTPYEEIGGYFSGDECVIALSHNPAAYVGVRVAEAKGGGAWADLVLCGHTMGGQINLAGRSVRSYPEDEARCLGGWYYTDDLPLLVTRGLGCQGVKLRLDADSEIWMITLKKPKTEAAPAQIGEEKRFLPKLGD